MIRALLLLGLVVVACGGSAPASEPPPSPPPPAPEPVPEPEPQPEPGTGAGCSGPPPGPDYECVRDCGAPAVRDTDPPPGWSWLTREQAQNRRQFGCPICLPADAHIATPSGSVPVSRLAAGDVVLSVDESGRRVASRVVHLGRARVPRGHVIARIELADGRVLRASRGHPGPDGRAVGALSHGDVLDGSVVVSVRHLPYEGETFDLVLDRGRSLYFSDGVLVQSSLAR